MKVKLGIAQFSSCHLDLDGSLQKLEQIMEQASKANVKLLVVGETWLSGYPAWLDHCADVARWDYPPMKEAFLKLYKSSISIPGVELSYISSLTKKYQLILCLGLNEKIETGAGQGTIYNSVVIIDEEGKLRNHHRKLMPTFTEKMLYGLGDGAGLKSVETSIGKITASICWEHWMPLTRQALHNAGEHIHVALWPTVHEMHRVASRHYAFEGRCFVVAAGQLLKAKDFPQELELPVHLKTNPDQWVLRGGSCVINPRGEFIEQPLFDQEKLLVTEIDTDQVVKERMTLDVSGHYQRPDVFNFSVNPVRN
ncbi:MAG: carbon-nitrogen hydrolase family protein [Flammeovirgaceae bacterium]|nr:carbon-nitrogen hydrolase family protein [Flammeovirgaceae bacterium]